MIDEDSVELAHMNPDKLWTQDKFILSRKMGYVCGPVGAPVPKPNNYIVRPAINPMGLGLGAEIKWIEWSTIDLPLGYFWCEIFSGRHLSIDYSYGKQILAVEGEQYPHDLTKWKRWWKVDDEIPLPTILLRFENEPLLNCEFIDGHLIEVHFRDNPNFRFNNSEYIPVWDNEQINPPLGYTFQEQFGLNSRKGGYIK